MTAAASLEAELIMKKAELNSYEKLLGKEHPYSLSIKTELQSLEDELLRIKSKNAEGKEKPFKSLFVQFENIPEIGKKYAKLYSDFLLQSKLQEFILPQLEQAKLKLLQETPSIEVIDKAVHPDYKSKPKRSIIVIVAIALGFILTYLIILFIEYLNWLKDINNQQYLEWVAIKNSWLKTLFHIKK